MQKCCFTYAEAVNELSGPSADVYDKLDLIRGRVGMPKVDREKYASKETLRQADPPNVGWNWPGKVCVGLIFCAGKMIMERWLQKQS